MSPIATRSDLVNDDPSEREQPLSVSRVREIDAACGPYLRGLARVMLNRPEAGTVDVGRSDMRKRPPQRPHLVMVSQWHEPEPVTRQGRLARGLVERGCDVTVLTTFPSYPHGRTYPGFRQRLRDINGTAPRVVRVPSFPSRSMSLLHRGLSYASFAVSATLLGLPSVRRPDVVWVYQPPPSVALPALIAKQAFQAPVVHEIQDMWPDTLVASGLRRDGRLTRSIERAMRIILARVDHIIVISRGFARLLEQRGTRAERITVIPNWSSVAVRAEPRDPSPSNTGLRLLYAGNIGPGQRLEFVIEALARANRSLPDSQEIELALLGDGPSLSAVTAAAAQHGVSVEVLPRVAPEEVAEVASAYDVMVVNLADDPVFRTTIPSKLITYLALGKPVLAGLGGDGADIVRDAKAGVTFEPEALDEAVAALTTLAGMPQEELRQLGTNARAAYESQFDAELLLDRYAALFERVIAQHRSQRNARRSRRRRLGRFGGDRGRPDGRFSHPDVRSSRRRARRAR